MSLFQIQNSKNVLQNLRSRIKCHKPQSSSSLRSSVLKINTGCDRQSKQNAKVQNLSHMKMLGENKWEILYLDAVVKKHIPKLPENQKKRIQEAISQKLSVQPEVFGESLRSPLHPYRKLRVGTYRVIFEIVAKNQVIICAIGHRGNVYQDFSKHR